MSNSYVWAIRFGSSVNCAFDWEPQTFYNLKSPILFPTAVMNVSLCLLQVPKISVILDTEKQIYKKIINILRFEQVISK